MVFCGSQSYPKKGYLDALANVAIANGTNAYTAEDHTCYNFTSASSEGLLAVLPVYLDHICRPILSNKHFKTEVFHVDVDLGKKSGVVYSEMTGRALTEADLLDLRMRQLIYGKSSPLALECGGKPFDIESLSIQKIQEYHRHYYHPSRLSILITGPVDPIKVFEAVSLYLDTTPFPTYHCTEANSPVLVTDLIDNIDDPTSIIQTFPSQDETIGSVGIGFKGPFLKDLKSLVAVNILFRALCESSAAPISQAFVECNPPICNSVDYDIRFYYNTCIVIIFSGIENGSSQAEEDEDSVSETSDVDESESEFVLGATRNDSWKELDSKLDSSINKLSNEFISKALMKVFASLLGSNFEGGSLINKALDRHQEKFLETLEEDTADVLYASYLWDVLVARHADTYGSTSPSSVEHLGKSLHIMPIFEELKNEKIEYWLGLLSNYCINSTWNMVTMVPQTNFFDLNPDLVFETMKENRNNETKKEIEENENLPEAVISELLTSPARFFATIGKFPFEAVFEVGLEFPGATSIQAIQHVTMQTNLIHFYFCFDISTLSGASLSYLVLFQELLLQSSLLQLDGQYMAYQDVVKFINENFLNLEACVGFGNSTFSCSYLGNVFLVYGSVSSLEKFQIAMRFIHAILFTNILQFEGERVSIIAQNLFTELTESFRDGQEVINTLSTKFFSQRCCAIIGENSVDFLRAMSPYKIGESISVLIQLDILKTLIEDCQNAEQIKLHLENLLQLRQFLASLPCLVQIGCSPQRLDPVKAIFTEIFSSKDASSEKFASRNDIIRNSISPDLTIQSGSTELTFVGLDLMRHVQYRPDYFTNPIICAVGGLTTSHLSISIPCDAILADSPIEYFSVILLCQLLSRTEGPFYRLIRGKGLAYDASLHFAGWNRQLELFLYESIDPKQAFLQIMNLFIQIKEEIELTGSSVLFSISDIDSARALAVYNSCSHQSSPSSVLSYARHGLFRGALTKEQMHTFDQHMFQVDSKAICKAFLKYMKLFLNYSFTNTILVCDTGRVSFWQQEFTGILPFTEFRLPSLE